MSQFFPSMKGSVRQLEELRDTESPFMMLTKRMLDSERRECVQLKNNSIYAYLMELG
jgi:hypothetical protein